jgi:hypothetical protein
MRVTVRVLVVPARSRSMSADSFAKTSPYRSCAGDAKTKNFACLDIAKNDNATVNRSARIARTIRMSKPNRRDSFGVNGFRADLRRFIRVES